MSIFGGSPWLHNARNKSVGSPAFFFRSFFGENSTLYIVKQLFNIVFCLRFLWLLISICILPSVSSGFEHINCFKNFELHLFLSFFRRRFFFLTRNLSYSKIALPTNTTNIYICPPPKRVLLLLIWKSCNMSVNWFYHSNLIQAELAFNFFECKSILHWVLVLADRIWMIPIFFPF